MADADGPLHGGTANRGRVIRIGDTVHRPRGPQSDAVHQLLNHLAAVGFAGAPRVLESRPDTEVLTFIPGVAAYEPLPAWALTDEALASFVSLLLDYHRSVETFDGTSLQWQRSVPARWRGQLICHNDLNPANVVFRNQVAVGVIDYDLAGPGSRAWDLAIAACFWVPLCDDRDIDDARRGRAFPRYQLLLDAYQAPRPLRQEIAEALIDANTWISTIIESGARHGHPAFGSIWSRSAQRYQRARGWLRTHQSRLSVL